MNGNVSLEAVIEMASSIKDELVALHDAYRQLVPILERERAAVGRSDLKAIEQITAEKVRVGGLIEAGIEQIQAVSRRLGHYYQRHLGISVVALNISDCLRMLRELSEALGRNSMGMQVLDHVINALDIAFQRFVELKISTQPKVEMNKYLTERLLHHHRETVRFWQELASESMATYGREGVQQSASTTSVFRAKA